MQTDFTGQVIDGATAAARIGERRIYFGHSYLGMLTQWRGGGWTHSLQNHGTAAFASPDLAERDFWRTKADLPQPVHKLIFGYERREVRP